MEFRMGPKEQSLLAGILYSFQRKEAIDSNSSF